MSSGDRWNKLRTLSRSVTKTASSLRDASKRTGIAAEEVAREVAPQTAEVALRLANTVSTVMEEAKSRARQTVPSAAMEEAASMAVDAGLSARDQVSKAARTASTVMEEAASTAVDAASSLASSAKGVTDEALQALSMAVNSLLKMYGDKVLTAVNVCGSITQMVKPDKIDDTLNSMNVLLKTKERELSELVNGFKGKLSDGSLPKIFNDPAIQQMKQVLSEVDFKKKRELLVTLAGNDQLKIKIINGLLPNRGGGGKNKYSKQKGGEESEMAVFIVLTLWGLYSAPLVMILFVLSGGWPLMAMIASNSDSLLGSSNGGGQKRLGRKSKKNKMVKKKRTIKSRKLVKYNSN